MSAATLRDIYNSAPRTLRGAIMIGILLIVYQVFPGTALLGLAGLGFWFLRGYQRFLVLFVIAAFWLLESCGFTSLATTRYRMAFEVEMNGTVKSASSMNVGRGRTMPRV